MLFLHLAVSLIFMLVVLPIFFALRRTRFWILWLLAASYFFYGWWKPYYLLLVVYSTTLGLSSRRLDGSLPRGNRGAYSRLIRVPVPRAIRSSSRFQPRPAAARCRGGLRAGRLRPT